MIGSSRGLLVKTQDLATGLAVRNKHVDSPCPQRTEDSRRLNFTGCHRHHRGDAFQQARLKGDNPLVDVDLQNPAGDVKMPAANVPDSALLLKPGNAALV